MRFIIWILIFSPFCAYTQQRPEYGKVRSDSSFNCHEFNQDSIPYGLGKICHSKNELEIRLKSIYRPNGGRELIVLSYANNTWDARKYMVTSGIVGSKIETTYFQNPYKNDHNIEMIFNNLFDTLKTNNIFLLPNQSEMGHELTVFDGTLYIITYKAGNKFRSYQYENPEAYLTQFPDKAEYRQLKTIIITLKNFFK